MLLPRKIFRPQLQAISARLPNSAAVLRLGLWRLQLPQHATRAALKRLRALTQ